MTMFVNRLASIALGERAPGAAQVVLPPRFAPAPAVAPLAAAQWPDAEEPEAAETTPPLPRHFPPQPRDAPRHQASRVPPSPMHVTPPPVTRRVTPPLSAARDMASLPRAAAMAASNEVRAAPHDDVGVPPLMVRIVPPEEHGHAPTRSAPLSPPLASPPHRDAPPLSEAAVASRIGRSDEPAPVIHVTIDRIDVRAPQAERPAPPAKAAQRQPAVSLGDYLRNGGSRA